MLTDEQVRSIGFASVGSGVQISDKTSFYGVSRIHIGNNVRIDDFCVISAGSGGIHIGNHVHIAVYVSMIGAGKIILDDFSGLSSRVAVYSSNDNYSGAYLTNPTVPSEFTDVNHAEVIVGKHVVVGSGSVILPGVTLGQGVAVGALSLVKSNCDPFGIYVGNPARRVKERRRDILRLEADLYANKNNNLDV